jgi:hypothetical protein
MFSMVIHSSDVFVRTSDMNECSKSIQISQKLKKKSQLIQSLIEDYHYDGNPIQLACFSKAFGDLEMLVQSKKGNFFLPVKKESLYDLYKLAHFMQISRDRMRAIQRELCYSIEEFRALPIDIKGMLQNDIKFDRDIQYHFVKNAIPTELQRLSFDNHFFVGNQKYICGFFNQYRQETETKKGFTKFKKKEPEKILETKSLVLFSLKTLFQNFNHSTLTPKDAKVGHVATIPLQNKNTSKKNVFIYSFGKFLFISEQANPSFITVFDDFQNVATLAGSSSIKKIAFNKYDTKKTAWVLNYTGSDFQIAAISWEKEPQIKVVLDRHIGSGALYDLLFDRVTQRYRIVYFSPSVDEGTSINHIYWKNDFNEAIQQRIKLNSELPLRDLGLSYANKIYFYSFSNKKIESGFIDGNSYALSHRHCKENSHFGKFCLSTNGFIHYFYLGSCDESFCSIGHSIDCGTTYQDLDKKGGEHRKILGNGYLSRKRDNITTITSLKPIMTLYKELLPQFKKSTPVQEPQNNNNNNAAVVIQ